MTPMTHAPRSLGRAIALIAVSSALASGLTWTAAAQAAPVPAAAAPAANATPAAAVSESVLLGWAGLTQDAPHVDGRIRIFTADGGDVTAQVAGIMPPTSCVGVDSPLCTQSSGVIHVPLVKPLPAEALVVVTGGSLGGKTVTGSLRAKVRVVDGKPEHVTVTLGSTVHLRLLNRGMSTRGAEGRTLAALGLHPDRSIGFTERHDAATLDRPGVIAALGRMGLNEAVDRTVASAIRRPGKKAAWLAHAERASAPQLRLSPGMSSALNWVGGNLASGVVSGLGGKALNVFLGWVGYDPDGDRINAAVKQIEDQMHKEFSILQKEILNGFSSLTDLVSAHETALACQASRNLVSNGITAFQSSIDQSTNYSAAWDAYVTAIADENASPASVKILLQEMSKWSPGSMSKIGQVTYRNAFSPLSGAVSSTSIAAGWQADLQCLQGTGGTISPLIADTTWPAWDGKGSGMPISVQMGTYYSGVAARGALLDAVFASFVQTCGAAPTATGDCPTGAKGGSPSVSTDDLWSKVYNPKCDMSVAQQVSCSSVNYYATISNALISPVLKGTAVDFRNGNMWSMANVHPSDFLATDPDSQGYWDFNADDETCNWQKTQGVTNCMYGYQVPTETVARTLLAGPATVSPIGSAGQINSVGMPSTAGPSNAVTYADVINNWFPSSPSRAQAAGTACGTSFGTNFPAFGVQRGLPAKTLMGFGPGSGSTADCTGSYGILLAGDDWESVCPTTLGAGDFSGPEWNVHGDGNASDGTWADKEDYKGNSLSMGFGAPQPSAGGQCAGWVYVDPPTLSNFWALVATGDQPDVAATPVSHLSLKQLFLDGTQTAESGVVAMGGGTISGHDPDNYPSWKVNPLGSYYAGIRYAPNDGTCRFRDDIVTNAIAIWGAGIPLCADVTVPTLVYRTTQGGFPYLYQDAWSSQNETTCPVWDQGGDSCGADNSFIAQPSESVDLAPTSSPSQANSVAGAVSGNQAVARLN